ncbi:MAG: carbon storage regulator [Planctomycetota bacterium]|nr:carbon storage regulator [Planctomycetota bacterium]MDA1178205.1 carbon storage regulator [Planctomycetota bacterium]
MLVLSRKIGEKIQIGNDVVITVVRVKGGVVRIGIEATPEIAIRRAELPDHGTDRKSTDRKSTDLEISDREATVGLIGALTGTVPRFRGGLGAGELVADFCR